MAIGNSLYFGISGCKIRKGKLKGKGEKWYLGGNGGNLYQGVCSDSLIRTKKIVFLF